MRSIIIRILLFSCLVLVLLTSLVLARETVKRYEKPDIKEDFCGIHINYQYCKCTFHNKMCNGIDMSSYDARTYTVAAYNMWWKEKAEDFGRACIRNDGIWNRPSLSCITCDVGFEKDKGRCVVNHASDDVAERYGLPTDFSQDDVRVVENRGKISYADGEVFVWSHSFQKWYGPVRPGHRLYTGDILLTTPRGEAKVTFYGDKWIDTMDIQPETRLNFPDVSPVPDEPIHVDIYNGVVEIYNAISDNIEEKFDDGAKLTPSRFNIRLGPSAVGIRGTDVILSYNEETQISEVILHEGIVDVYTDSTNKITISPGQQINYDDGFSAISTFDDFEEIQEKFGFDTEKFITPDSDLTPLNMEPIDPDTVYPIDVMYDGEFAEDIIIKKKTTWWLWLLIGALIAGVYVKREELLPFLYT